ncbi:hypothetical protein EDB87DRAFT_1581964 [Lactarius vividus]|nr:hypothetical protein EDB87DRAFT_1581964 [Lactarius vividus]
MALQIAEAYNKTCNNPYKISPGEFYDSLLKVQVNTLTKAVKTKAANNLDTSTIHQQVCKETLKNDSTLAKINNKVKQAIFAELNKEAMDDIDTWHEIYREEFKDIMHQYIGINKFGIDPYFIKPDRKGKRWAKSSTPELQQSNEEIERIMHVDCQVQIDAMCSVTLTEMTNELHREIAAYKSAELIRLQVEANQHLQAEIEALKTQFQEEHEAQVYQHCDDIRDQIKLWKVNHANARKFNFIKHEAKNLGYTLTTMLHSVGRTSGDRT